MTTGEMDCFVPTASGLAMTGWGVKEGITTFFQSKKGTAYAVPSNLLMHTIIAINRGRKNYTLSSKPLPASNRLADKSLYSDNSVTNPGDVNRMGGLKQD